MKRELQILVLQQIKKGRYKVEINDNRIEVFGPKGEIKFDYTDSYAKFAMSLPKSERGSYGNRKPNIRVHHLVLLWQNLAKLTPDDDITMALFDEDMHIDHVNRNQLDNSPENLEAKPPSSNQRNKSKRPELSPNQLEAIKLLLTNFPKANIEALSSSIGRTRGEIRRIAKAMKDDLRSEL